MGGRRYEQTPASASRLFALSHDLMGALDLEGRIVWTNPVAGDAPPVIDWDGLPVVEGDPARPCSSSRT